MDHLRHDIKFCNQVRDAASSVTRNIAEGFGRYGHREMAQFVSIARGSLFEVEDHLRDGVARKYWDTATAQELHQLCNRTIAAATSLLRYLKLPATPRP